MRAGFVEEEDFSIHWAPDRWTSLKGYVRVRPVVPDRVIGGTWWTCPVNVRAGPLVFIDIESLPRPCRHGIKVVIENQDALAE